LRRNLFFNINSILKTKKISSQKSTHSFHTHSLININFLRKERLYTKLKYSRSPAYDIVSGGTAAILAGFLGFLVSEKFGFELVDSGDFYYLFMYCVFTVFIIRPLLNIINTGSNILLPVSPKNIVSFYIKI
jgi:hypothetical protein